MREGGLEALGGARHLGRLLAGLLPTLLLVAALVQVSGANTLSLANLTAAPLTAQQTLVRLLVGVTLLVVLPWWSARSGEQVATEGSAGAYAGRLVQAVALAAFWAAIVLPAPGDLPWAIALFVLGTLFAYVTYKDRRRSLGTHPPRRRCRQPPLGHNPPGSGPGACAGILGRGVMR